MKPVCMVIGAGAGIGGNVGKRFAREGYHSVLCRRSDQDGLDQLVQSIEDQGGSATGFLMNAVEPDSIEKCVDKVETDIGPIDTLVFNLGAQVGNKSLSEKNSKYIYWEPLNGILDLKKIDNLDVVIHLAALSTDPLCKGKAYQCFDTNVMGTLNLMNVAMKKNVTQFIFASSEWVYSGFTGNEEKNEEATIDITKISSEYALSKLVSEANLRQQYTLGFCDVTILRFGIIYGHKNGKGSAVESIARTVKNCESITTKSLKTGRRFVHVKDIARGIIQSLGLKNFEIINLSGNKVDTLKEIIEISERIFHTKIDIIEIGSVW